MKHDTSDFQLRAMNPSVHYMSQPWNKAAVLPMSLRLSAAAVSSLLDTAAGILGAFQGWCVLFYCDGMRSS